MTGRRRGRQIVRHGGYLCCAGDERSLAVPSWEHPDHLVRGDRQHLALYFVLLSASTSTALNCSALSFRLQKLLQKIMEIC